MPRRNDIQKILVIGSGPIVIGQSAEFDYSGTQACKALKQEGYEVVLVNSNPATIMTDPELADRTYIEPLTREYVEEIIRIEAEMLAASPAAGKFAAAAHRRRTDGAESGCRSGRRGHSRQLQRGVDRRQARSHQEGRRPSALQGCDDAHRPRCFKVGAGEQSARRAGLRQQARLPGADPAQLYAGRHRAAALPTTAKS